MTLQHQRDKVMMGLGQAESFLSSFERWRYDSGVTVEDLMMRRIKELEGKNYVSGFDPAIAEVPDARGVKQPKAEENPQMETSKEGILRIVRVLNDTISTMEQMEPEDSDWDLPPDTYDTPGTGIPNPDAERSF